MYLQYVWLCHLCGPWPLPFRLTFVASWSLQPASRRIVSIIQDIGRSIHQSLGTFGSLLKLQLNNRQASSSSSGHLQLRLNQLQLSRSIGAPVRMYFELLFASLVVLTTFYMCHMINDGPANFGYRRYHSNDEYDDYADSTSESEFNAFHLDGAGPSPRSSRWSSTTFSSDDSDGEPEQDLIFTDPTPSESDTRTSFNLPNRNHPTLESEITEIEVEPLDSPVYHRLVTRPRYTEHTEVPWIINPLFQESAS